MTIAEFRIYYHLEDKELQDHLTKTLWGFAIWFERRLKPITPKLNGPEAKGVNLVNLVLHETEKEAWRLDEWHKRANAFEYECIHDLRGFQDRTPIENIKTIMPFASEIAQRAPWPQVVALGDAMSNPLSETEQEELLPFLRWPRDMFMRVS